MDHSIIPPEWKKFLATVQQFFPSAIIAGGALRDLIVEKPIKDVDIFISDMDMNVDQTGVFEQLANALGIAMLQECEESDRDFLRVDNDFKSIKVDFSDVAAKTGQINSEYLSADSDRVVYESFINYIVSVKYNSVIYQLILTEAEPKSYVYNDFDFGICKIFFDGNKLTATEEFWYDYENKQITFAGKFSVGQAIHTLFTHRENIIKKFPGWKVVIEDLRKREPHEMPQSYKDAIARMDRCAAARSEKEEVKITFNSSPTTATSMRPQVIQNSGYSYEYDHNGDVYVTTADGQTVRVMPVQETDNYRWEREKIDTSWLSKNDMLKMHGLDGAIIDQYTKDLANYMFNHKGDGTDDDF